LKEVKTGKHTTTDDGDDDDNNKNNNAGTSNIRTMNIYIRIVAKQCSLGTWFVSGI
jgi:hypothetical protein